MLRWSSGVGPKRSPTPSFSSPRTKPPTSPAPSSMSTALTWRPSERPRVIPLVCHSRLGDLYPCEGRHDLAGDPFELFQAHLFRDADRQTYRDPIEAWIAPFERLQMFDDLLRRAAQHAAIGDGVLDPQQLGGGGALGIAHDLDLLVGERAHQPQLAEHLHILFVIFRGFANPLLAVFGEIKVKAEAEPLAHFEVLTLPGVRLLPAEDDLVHGPAFGRAAAAQTPDAVFRHEVEGACRAALNRLPALAREPQRAGDNRQLLEGIAAVGHFRRQSVMLATMRERLFVERLEDDVDLFLEELAVGRLIEQRRSKRLHFPGMVPAADAENNAAAGKNVGRREIFGQPQGMPHRRNIKAAADFQTLGDMGEVHRRHQYIGDALVTFMLEMVLGHPEGIVSDAIH